MTHGYSARIIILFKLLSLGCPFCILAVCGVLFIVEKYNQKYNFLAVCGFVQVACQGFLVREACVGVVVGGAGFLLSGLQ